eukprot:gnl/TRDRNA2_/TRDRNA2_59978_c0_seq1.p1 gnl/TRDRNA2_/TRDRNA2_59978_c0~~gnl/TRDRNA2_/TRDRNA2_59978_c0_seq1.p1  ORF type:complete len:266 (+),score=39.93 gnl/TRDRNA2_/TRDRNA2_59978_c0_seq1:36-833(+)
MHMANSMVNADLLTERMRKCSRQVHDKSDRLVNLKLGLVLTSRPLYGEAIALFAPIYRRIEEIFDRHADHPQLGKLIPYLAVMRRAGAMEADVSFFCGAERLKSITMRQAEGEPPELAAYLARLDDIEKQDPVLLLAYLYHMYLAIFAGGAQIKRLVSKVFGLKDDQGVHTFCFKDLDTRTKTTFKNDFKASINNDITVTDEEAERLMEESIRVFAQNNALVATIKDSRAFASAASAFAITIAKWSTIALLASGVVWAIRQCKSS